MRNMSSHKTTLIWLVLFLTRSSKEFQIPHFFTDSLTQKRQTGGLYLFKLRSAFEADEYMSWDCEIEYSAETAEAPLFVGADGRKFVSVAFAFDRIIFFYYDGDTTTFSCTLISDGVSNANAAVRIAKRTTNVTITSGKNTQTCISHLPLTEPIPQLIYVGDLNVQTSIVQNETDPLRNVISTSWEALKASAGNADQLKSTQSVFVGIILTLRFFDADTGKKVGLIQNNVLRPFSKIVGYKGNVKEYHEACVADACLRDQVCTVNRSVETGGIFHCLPCPYSCRDGSRCVKTKTNPSCICSETQTDSGCFAIGEMCENNPVCERGLCYDTKNGPQCLCELYFDGLTCNQCDGIFCVNGDCLRDGENSRVCVCHAGWKGSSCNSTAHCFSDPCSGNRDCLEVGENNITCMCSAGWFGVDCRMENPCLSYPCGKDSCQAVQSTDSLDVDYVCKCSEDNLDGKCNEHQPGALVHREDQTETIQELTCVVIPSNGTELETIFKISCTPVLEFPGRNGRFRIPTKILVQIFQTFGKFFHVPIINETVMVSKSLLFFSPLSAGKATDDFGTNITITTSDSKRTAQMTLTVSVHPSRNMSFVQKQLLNIFRKIRNQAVLKLTDALEMVSFIGNYKAHLNETTITRIISVVSEQLSDLKVRTIYDFQNSLRLASSLLDNTSQVTVTHLLSVAESLGRMGKTFIFQIQHFNFGWKLKTTSLFVEAISKLFLRFKELHLRGNLNSTDSQKLMTANSKSSSLLFNITGVVAESLKIQEPLAVNSSELSIYIGKFNENMLRSYIVYTPQGNVRLPTIFLSSGVECYAMEVVFFANNPYWDIRSKLTYSGPAASVHIQFCHEANAGLVASDILRTLFRRYVVSFTQPEENYQSGTVNKTLETVHQMVYHTIPLRRTTDLKLFVFPQTDSYLDVFIGYNYLPTASNFTLFYSLPLLNGSNGILLSSRELKSNFVEQVVVGVRKPFLKRQPETPSDKTSNSSTVIQYRFKFGNTNCLLWQERDRTWLKNSYCKVLSDSETSVRLQPGAVGITGAMFASRPTTINYGAMGVLARNIETDSLNFEVIALVAVILFVFYEGLLFHHSVDKLDHKHWRTIKTKSVFGSRHRSGHLYEVHVHTGDFDEASETCFLDVNIHGTKGSSGLIRLGKDDKELVFHNSGITAFLVLSSRPLGTPTKLELLISSEESRDLNWHLNLIVVMNMKDFRWVPFIYRNWVITNSEAVEFVIELYPSEEKHQPNIILFRNFRNVFMNSHSWISPFYRTGKTTFTRMQRWTCSIFTVMTLLCCNTLWLKLPHTENVKIVDIGDWKIPTPAFVEAFYSSIFVLVLTALLTLLFSKTQISHKDEEMHFMTSAPLSQIRNHLVLPHVTLHIAHAISHATIWMAGLFCVFTSLEWERVTTRIWIVMLVTGIVLNVVVLQPIQVLLSVFSITFIHRFDTDLLFYHVYFPQ